jgi:hypothetical protein
MPQLVCAPQSALANYHCVARRFSDEAFTGAKRNFKSAEIAIIYTD